MTIFKTLALIFSALLILQGCGGDQGTILDKDQLHRLIVREKSFEWVAHGFTGSVTFEKANQSTLIVAALGSDQGTWEQKNDQICVQFERVLQGTQHCAKVMRLLDGTYEARDSKSNRRLGLFYPLKSDRALQN